MGLSIAACCVAVLFAINIGASGTAAAMGSAYGSGAIRSRVFAVVLTALFAAAGACFGGAPVVTTISKGIVPEGGMTPSVSVIILASACIVLFAANRLGIPLSTSEVTVGAIVGCGLASGQILWPKLAWIAASWLVLPFAAYLIAFLLGRLIRPAERRLLTRFPRVMPHVLTLLLIGAGCYEAYSAGMNNVANAAGPIIGSGLIGLPQGLAIGAICIAFGAVAMGGRVLETNGKRITSLSLLQGTLVSTTGGTLVMIASLFGLPVPLTQATTMAIVGIGSESHGPGSVFGSAIVKRILFVWVASPISALIVAWLLRELSINGASVLRILLAAMPFTAALLFLLARGRRFGRKKQQPV